MIVVDRDVAIAALVGLAGNFGKGVPDAGALAIHIPGTFDLVGRRGGSP